MSLNELTGEKTAEQKAKEAAALLPVYLDLLAKCDDEAKKKALETLIIAELRTIFALLD